MASLQFCTGDQIGKAFLSAMGLQDLTGVRSVQLDLTAGAIATMTIERFPDVAELQAGADLLDQLITERYQVVKVEEPADHDAEEHY